MFYPDFQLDTGAMENEYLDKLIISIIWNVEFKRRDYDFLINFLSEFKDKQQDRICFKIIGNVSALKGPEIKNEKLMNI